LLHDAYIRAKGRSTITDRGNGLANNRSAIPVKTS
ncbi:unnamed protein product, partial [Rotaria sp. Silwood1]